MFEVKDASSLTQRSFLPVVCRMTTCTVLQFAVAAGKSRGKTMLLWLISLAMATDVTKFLAYTTLCLVIQAPLCLHLLSYTTE